MVRWIRSPWFNGEADSRELLPRGSSVGLFEQEGAWSVSLGKRKLGLFGQEGAGTPWVEGSLVNLNSSLLHWAHNVWVSLVGPH